MSYYDGQHSAAQNAIADAEASSTGPAPQCFRVVLADPGRLPDPSGFFLRLHRAEEALLRVSAALESGPGASPGAWQIPPEVAASNFGPGARAATRWKGDPKTFYRVLVLEDLVKR